MQKHLPGNGLDLFKINVNVLRMLGCELFGRDDL